MFLIFRNGFCNMLRMSSETKNMKNVDNKR